jgi:hypothetical protein
MEKQKQPKIIRELYEKGIWATRDNLFDKLRVGRKLREQEAPDLAKGASPDLISRIQGTLQKYGVKSSRSFQGWELEGGLADDRSFMSIFPLKEGFGLKAKSGTYTVQEATEAKVRLGDILACLKELESIAQNLVAK